MRTFDAAHNRVTRPSRQDRLKRDRLVTDAGQALWYLMVQRDACGLYDTKALVTDYGVPSDMVNSVGFAVLSR